MDRGLDNSTKILAGRKELQQCWRMGKLPTRFIQQSCHSQHKFFFPRTPNDLHADWQSLRRSSHGNHGGRKAQEVEPLAVAPRIQILHGLPFHLPLAFAVSKRRNRRRWAEKNGITSHLKQDSFPEIVASEPRCQQRVAGVLRIRGGPRSKLAQHRTEFRLSPAQHWG